MFVRRMTHLVVSDIFNITCVGAHRYQKLLVTFQNISISSCSDIGNGGNVSQPSQTFKDFNVKGYRWSALVKGPPTRIFMIRNFIKLISISYFIPPPFILHRFIWDYHKGDKILVAELKKGFLLRDLTIVQSEMVVLSVLGYSGTQKSRFYDEGVLSVSGHCHL